MGDPARFRKFADLIAKTFPDYREARIADVAGGKGALQAALRQLGYVNITSFDKRKGYSRGMPGTRRAKMYRYGWFDCRKMEGEWDLVVGMHPDGGTDHIIEYGRINRVPFIVCPCCAIPSATTFWGSLSKYRDWMDHLTKLAREASSKVSLCTIPIDGRSQVIIGE